jgi:hypothetical protein
MLAANLVALLIGLSSPAPSAPRPPIEIPVGAKAFTLPEGVVCPPAPAGWTTGGTVAWVDEGRLEVGAVAGRQ